MFPSNLLMRTSNVAKLDPVAFLVVELHATDNPEARFLYIFSLYILFRYRMNQFGDHDIMYCRTKTNVHGRRSSTVLEARGGSSDGETEALEEATPKLHFFCTFESGSQCRWVTHRFFWCYSEEDIVGQLVEVVESCHSSTMSTTALFKWLTFVFAEDHED